MKRPLPSIYLRLPSPVAPLVRAPLLERLLARAGGSSTATDWRGDAFRLIAPDGAPPPAPGAAALFAARGPGDGACAYLATPVHYEAAMTSVHLAPQGILRFEAAQAAQLAADFNRRFAGGGQRLIAGGGALIMVFDRALVADTHDPQEALGLDIGPFQAVGADANGLRRLGSEIEMWLFDHALNRPGATGGSPPVSGLWLWGGGAVVQRLPAIDGWTAGDDALFGAWPAAATAARAAATHAVALHTTAGHGSRSGVVVLSSPPGTDGWPAAEAHWLWPPAAELAAGRLRCLSLSAGRRCHAVDARFKWRLWRRPRPWWEYFA